MQRLQYDKAIIFSISFFAMLARHSCLTSWSMIKQDVGHDLHFSSTVLGGFDSTFLAFYAGGNFICGVLGDRFPLKVVVPIGILIAASSYGGIVLMGLVGSGSIAGFLFCFAAAGISQATVLTGGVAVMGNWFEKEKRGRVMGFWATNSLFGDLLGTQLASLLFVVAKMPWQGVLFTAACILTSSGVIFFLFVKEKPPNQSQKISFTDSSPSITAASPLIAAEGNRKQGIGLMGAIKLPGVAIYAGGFGCVKMLHYTFVFWLPTFINEYLGEDGAIEGTLAGSYSVGGIIGALAGGYLIERYSLRAPVVVPMVGLSLPFILVFLFASSLGVWFYFILIPCIGFMIAGAHALISTAIAADLAQNDDLQGNNESLSTVTGIIDGVGGFGAALGQVLIGVLSTEGEYAVISFMLSIGFIGFLTLLPMIFRELRRHRQKLEDEKSLSLRTIIKET